MNHRSSSRATADNQAATTIFQSILTEKRLVLGSFLASAPVRFARVATMIIYDQPPKRLPDFNGPIRSKNTTMVDEPARDQSTTAIVAGLVRGC